jgi:hypothetical protein
MCRIFFALVVPTLIGMLTNSVAEAQRGIGQTSGIARQGLEVQRVTLSGVVVEVEVGPCENTTGRSLVGTHFFLKTPDGKTLNIHLGPADQMEEIVDALRVEEKVQVQAFRTERMQADHYVARSITVGGEVLRLRDDNLRPVWAGPPGRSADGLAPDGRGSRQGWRTGPGSGWNRGAGGGRGTGRDWGT